MSGAPVDVSDAAPTTPSCSSTTTPKSVTWRQHLVASEVVGTLATLEPSDLAQVWPELWVSSDEIAMARCQARLERIALPQRMTSITPRTYAGHKRPSHDELPASAQLQAAASETATQRYVAARGSTSDGIGGRSGLCLNRAVLSSVSSGIGSAVSPPHSPFSGSASPVASMGAGPSIAPASLPCSHPACGQTSASAAGLCLQRAGSVRGVPHGFGVPVLSHAASAPLVPPHPRRRSSANPQTGRRHAASQHGLSMSQRVAALQIGSPATYVQSSLPPAPPLVHSATHP